MGKFDKYTDCGHVLTCPVCGGRLQLQERSLVCDARHSFDIAKQGYVNLYRGKPINEYTKESFQERQTILQRGMYAHLLGEVRQFLEETYGGEKTGTKRVLLDAGCGEGYYSRELAEGLAETLALDLYGADLSRDSVQLAAGTANGRGSAAAEIKWIVADIGRLPIADRSCDVVLDIFTSANYQEFQRILADEGYLVKIIPGEGHVKELREAARDQLFHKEYADRKGAAVFAEQFQVVLRKTVSRTFEVTPEERDIFIGMTPLLFAVDKTKIDWEQIKTITVEGELLIGKKKDNAREMTV